MAFFLAPVDAVLGNINSLGSIRVRQLEIAQIGKEKKRKRMWVIAGDKTEDRVTVSLFVHVKKYCLNILQIRHGM